MSRLIVLLCLCTAGLFGQFLNLATTDDGSAVYFSSTLRLRGTDEPAWEKLFRAGAAGVSLVAARDRIVTPLDFLTNQFAVTGAELSGDGRVLFLITRADCAIGGSSCFLGQPKYQSEIVPAGAGAPLRGQIRLSRNGRYAVTCCDGALASRTILYDLQTGAQRDLQNTVYVRPAVSSTGLAVAAVRTGLLVAGFDGSREFPTAAVSQQVAVDDRGSVAVYVGTLVDGEKLLALVNLSTGQERLLSRGMDLALAGISNNGDRIAYLHNNQLFTISRAGVRRRQVTTDASGIAEAVLAGSGDIAFAVTFAGRLLRIDLPTGDVAQWIGQTPMLAVPCCTPPEPVAGSAFCITGRGLAESPVSAAPPMPAGLGGLSLLLDGLPVPLESVAPTQACFQIPWETAIGEHTLTALAESDPHFEGAGSGPLHVTRTSFANFAKLGPPYPQSVALTPFPLAAHGDFSALVTPDTPAQPGEILHFYMTGLGPVTPAVPTGEASPSDPPAFAVVQPTCRLATFQGDASTPVEVLFAGLAPGLVGYYQLSLRLPSDVPVSSGQALLSCWAGADYAGESVWLPVVQ